MSDHDVAAAQAILHERTCLVVRKPGDIERSTLRALRALGWTAPTDPITDAEVEAALAACKRSRFPNETMQEWAWNLLTAARAALKVGP